jgi:hypothetical protein
VEGQLQLLALIQRLIRFLLLVEVLEQQQPLPQALEVLVVVQPGLFLLLVLVLLIKDSLVEQLLRQMPQVVVVVPQRLVLMG